MDADAEAAVRVIAYFDELEARRARLADLVRATAALAECVAGLQPDGTTLPLRFSPEGDRAGDAVAEPTSADLGRDAGGRVWLERPGSSRPLDDLVLERFALAARLLIRPEPVPVAPQLADPALIELLLGGQAAAEDRARALVLLGLDATRPVCVAAVSTEDGSDPGAAAVGLLARGGPLPRPHVAAVGGGRRGGVAATRRFGDRRAAVLCG